MVEFLYKAVDKSGRKLQGTMDVPSEGDLRMALRSQGLRPTKIARFSAMNADIGVLLSGGSQSVPVESLVVFTRQLQVLISSGIPIVQGLEILSDQIVHKGFRNIVISIREKVSGGAYFWESLSAYPNAFPKLYVALIRAGEASGSLDQLLKRLSRYLEDADRLRKMVKSAMMYPTIVITIAIGVITIMLAFVIPKFEELLTTSGQTLPAPTQFVIDLSHFLVSHGLKLIAALGAAYWMFRKYAKSKDGRIVLDRILFRVPLVGNIMQKAGIARFSRTMQTLIGSGINLIDAMDICKATIGNAVLEEAVGTIRKEIEAGKTLGAVINKLEVFPKMATQMISVGESTGNLDKMLEKVADFYEDEVETLVGGMTKLIEPFILVFLGGTVGGLMIAMYLPIFKLAGGASD
jgi:type IV pilus assembly protein PilC